MHVCVAVWAVTLTTRMCVCGRLGRNTYYLPVCVVIHACPCGQLGRNAYYLHVCVDVTLTTCLCVWPSGP